jgi:hypothetical protein
MEQLADAMDAFVQQVVRLQHESTGEAPAVLEDGADAYEVRGSELLRSLGMVSTHKHVSM